MKQFFFHCTRKKGDRWIPVQLNIRDLQKSNLKIEQVSARLTTESHLFISGIAGKKDETVQLEHDFVSVCCNIVNSNGNILFHIEDPYPKNFKLNPSETFFLVVYQINRFVDTNEISSICLYCQFVQ